MGISSGLKTEQGQVLSALQQYFQVRLQGDRMVRKHMMCVRDLAAFIRAEHGA